MLENRALVLNRSWTPISTTSVRRAIVLVVRGAAGVVDPQTCEVGGWEAWTRTSAGDGPVIRGFALPKAPSAPRWPGGLDPASIRARPSWHRFVPASALAVGA